MGFEVPRHLPFHNGVTPCPVCDAPVNYSTESVIRFPEVLGPHAHAFAERAGIYHRECFYELPEFAAIAEHWADIQRQAFSQRNARPDSLMRNVVAFETPRYLCYRYLDNFEHQLFGFPQLVDWHLAPEQLQLLHRFFLGLDEDTYNRPQQVFAPDFTFNIDPEREQVQIIRYWSLVLPVIITDAEFVALGDVLNLDADFAEHPQLVDFAHLTEEIGVHDHSEDPEFIPDNLYGEVVGFAPSQLHEGMISLNVRIHPKDSIPLSLWEAMELRAQLCEYVAGLEVPWQAEPLPGFAIHEGDEDDFDLNRLLG